MRKKRVTIVAAALIAAAIFTFFYFSNTKPETGADLNAGKTPLTSRSNAGYVDPDACRPCHSDVYETYQHTGMGKSFSRLQSDKTIEDWTNNNVFYHPASDRYYTMFERDGRFYQRRHQIGLDGREINVVKKVIDFVIGSGNHARTYLNKTDDGKLFQLPVGWYSEKGGFWAMSPGYDRSDHQAFSRRITHECMFCHNGYPAIEPGSDDFGREARFTGQIPEGIDCQRCHGPGQDHIRAVQTPEATLESIRSAITNPARLSPERQLEVCMQCHLETTSARLPPYVRRYDRGFYSFRPGEPLADYILHFDHAPGTRNDDKFEIVSAPYRLRMSACFQQSNGALTCLTCHNPHRIPRGDEAKAHYVQACQSCHEPALKNLIISGQHTESPDCLDCHMPKRRTDDVVHVIMTDHSIQRFKPQRELLAPLEESRFYGHQYLGEVVSYYPMKLASTDEGDLYAAVAQIQDNANLEDGISRLEAAIQKYKPGGGAFYFELAEGYSESGRFEKAVPLYKEALQREPDLWPAQHKMGIALSKLGQYAQAAQVLEKAAAMGTEEPTTLNDLALIYRQLGNLDGAISTLRQAIELDPDIPQLHNNLGGLLLETGDEMGAATAFRNAIRILPNFAAAHNNLGKLLARRDDFHHAQYHFEEALRHYPGWAEAHLNLGTILAIQGNFREALSHLKEAAQNSDPKIRKEAQETIERINRVN
ncbi:MAG: tetratricopeptide repeat protein [Acidobacteriota bacterium]